MANYLDDVFVYGAGYPEILGESNRGLQFMGATAASRVQNPALAAAFAKRVAQRKLLMSETEPQNLDSGFLPVTAVLTLTDNGAHQLDGGIPSDQSVDGEIIPQAPFKAAKLMVGIAVQIVSSTASQNQWYSSQVASDVWIGGVFSGATNCLSVPPASAIGAGSSAVNCGAFPNNGLGNGVAWKTVDKALKFKINFLLSQTLNGTLSTQIAAAVNGGAHVSSITVTVSATAFGENAR